MNSLDANVVLRYILRDIAEQSLRAEVIIAGSQCYVSDVIVTEIAFVLEKSLGVSREDVVQILKKFLGLRTVICNQDLLKDTIDLFASERKLSFPDCYASAEAFRTGRKLATFDKALAKFGGSHVFEP